MTANETGCFSAKVRTIAIQPLIRAMLVFADRALFFPLLFVGIMPFKVWVPALDLISIFGKQRRCPHDYFCSTVVVKIN